MLQQVVAHFGESDYAVAEVSGEPGDIAGEVVAAAFVTLRVDGGEECQCSDAAAAGGTECGVCYRELRQGGPQGRDQRGAVRQLLQVLIGHASRVEVSRWRIQNDQKEWLVSWLRRLAFDWLLKVEVSWRDRSLLRGMDGLQGGGAKFCSLTGALCCIALRTGCEAEKVADEGHGDK